MKIIGKNIILKEIHSDDAEHISKWFSDKENIKHMSTFVRTKEHSIEKVKKDLETTNPEFERLFMIYLKGNNRPIGHCGIDDLDLHDKRGEIFFLIGEKEFQGKGYSKEIIILLLKIGFEKLKLNSLFASATIENNVSLKTLERTGFKKIGTRREYNFINEKYVNELFFDIILKDYKKIKKDLNTQII